MDDVERVLSAVTMAPRFSNLFSCQVVEAQLTAALHEET